MKTFWKYFFLLLSTSATAQNLVPNPSFEDTVACPSTVDEVYKATGWHSYRPSPDYFNACADSASLFSVPYNGLGYQYPHTGNAYCGFFSYGNPFGSPNYREIIGAQLITPLSIGMKYFVSFWVNMTYGTYFSTRIATNKIGALFSTVSFDSIASPAPVNNFAHVYTDSILTDTAGWYKISGSFIADSAYNFISVGNFFNDANTDTIMFSSSTLGGYYFVDDVCVSSDSLTCNENLESVYIKPIQDFLFDIFPNPTAGKIHIINNSGQPFELSIYTPVGQLIFNDLITEREKFLNMTQAKGVYLIIIKQKGNYFQRKIIKY